MSIRSTRTAPIRAPMTVPEPPKMFTPPNDGCGDGLQFEPQPGHHGDRAEACEEHEPGKSGQHPRKHKGDEDGLAGC